MTEDAMECLESALAGQGLEASEELEATLITSLDPSDTGSARGI